MIELKDTKNSANGAIYNYKGTKTKSGRSFKEARTFKVDNIILFSCSTTYMDGYGNTFIIADKIKYWKSE